MSDDHRCPVCGSGFDRPTPVRDHAWDAHGACHHCGEAFDDRESLYRHWLDAHESDLSGEARRRAGNAVGDRTLCPVCETRFDDVEAVLDHALDAHGACHRCGESFEEDDAVYAHLLGAHEGDLAREERSRAEAVAGGLDLRSRLRHQGPAAVLSNVSVGRRTVLGLAGGAALGGVGALVATGRLGLGGGGATLADHPAAADLSAQPVIGPSPDSARATIVAFEDPTCPACRRFETAVWPTLKRNLVDPGDAAFVFRGVTFVDDGGWARQGALALEAAHELDPAAFEALKSGYYRSQGRITRSNVLSVTRELLANAPVDVDTDRVVTAVREGQHAAAVDADLTAARRAGVRGTPTFYLFRDGSYVTTIVGPRPYSTFAGALGVDR